MDPRPSPDALDRQSGELLASREGRAVFPRLPPGVKPLPLLASTARFRAPDGAGSRLVAALATPGLPAESPWSEAVVLDSAMIEVARLKRTAGPSSCDPAEERTAEFDFQLAPGRYLVGLAVSDGADGRGTWRDTIEVPVRGPGIAISDLELTCGPPPPVGDPEFRVGANPAARVEGATAGVYFEIYGLKAGRDGMGRFSLEYTVRGANRDPRIWIQRLFAPRSSLPMISATRTDEHAGELRRQYVSIPVTELPRGRYRLIIRVTDELAHAQAQAETIFERE
jgi:hypothetical protein